MFSRWPNGHPEQITRAVCILLCGSWQVLTVRSSSELLVYRCIYATVLGSFTLSSRPSRPPYAPFLSRHLVVYKIWFSPFITVFAGLGLQIKKHKQNVSRALSCKHSQHAGVSKQRFRSVVTVVMYWNLEQRYSVKFSFKLGKTAKQTFGMIKQPCRDVSINRSSIFEWHQLFCRSAVSIKG